MNTKDKISLFLLISFYGLLMLFNVRYFPGDPLQTFISTASNILTLAAVAVAMTLAVVSAMQKIVGQRLPWDRVLRFYLFFAILIWGFAIMYTYFDMVEREKKVAAEVALQVKSSLLVVTTCNVKLETRNVKMYTHGLR